jgi:hypothetical protein
MRSWGWLTGMAAGPHSPAPREFADLAGRQVLQGAEFGIRTPGRRDCSRIISTPYLEKLVCLEYNVARTVARKGGGKPADRKYDCPGVSACLRGRCYVPLGDSR